ncbi:hypothetical protein GQ472_01580 [archaeon]|nr:hypothetical protein [archaeon]
MVAVLVCVLAVSGCTSYDSCMEDCMGSHDAVYDASYMECYDSIDFSECLIE